MKVIVQIFIAILPICISGCEIRIRNKNERQEIIISGSNTIHPLVKAISDQYSKEHPGIKFYLNAEGSNTGIEKLKMKQTDIATSSRQLRDSEYNYFTRKNINIKEKIVAFDAIAIIVNTANPVGELTLEQVKRIFSGEVKNWKEVGGYDMDITVVRRDSDKSGTDDFFNEKVLHGEEPSGNVISEESNDEIISKIRLDKSAISYMGFGYLDRSIKRLALSLNAQEYYLPTRENVQSQIYPIIRPLYFYYKKDYTPAEHFIGFVLSKKGQSLVENTNYVPLKKMDKSLLYIPPL